MTYSLVRIIKYSRPTKLDKEPYGTQILSFVDNDTNELYIQVSQNIDDPEWQRAGEFLETLFNEHLMNRDFMDFCLSNFKYREEFLEKIKKFSA